MLLIVVYAVRFTQISSLYFGTLIALKCRKVIVTFPELKLRWNSIVSIAHPHLHVQAFYSFSFLGNLIKLVFIGFVLTSSFMSFILDIMQRYVETSKQRLDLAILVFFQNFRKSYVGDQAIHSSKVHNWNLFAVVPKCQKLSIVISLAGHLIHLFLYSNYMLNWLSFLGSMIIC